MHALQIKDARSTLDIDLLGRISNDTATITRVVGEIIDEKIEPDGLDFDKDSIVVSEISKDADYNGRRIRFKGNLGVLKIPMQIDIGFGDPLIPAPQKLKMPSILDFESPEMMCYAPETSIAEKAHAIFYLGLANSRMKDFYDISLLSRKLVLDSDNLAKAISATFKVRGTTISKNSIVYTEEFFNDDDKQKQWSTFLRKRHITDTPEQFSDIAREVMTFLKPFLNKAREFD